MMVVVYVAAYKTPSARVCFSYQLTIHIHYRGSITHIGSESLDLRHISWASHGEAEPGHSHIQGCRRLWAITQSVRQSHGW